MTNKEKIIIEVKRLVTKVTSNSPYHCGWRDGLMMLETFIDSLPAEKRSGDLDEYISELLETYPINKDTIPTEALNDYHQGLILGSKKIAKWQKEQTINKACEWLNKNVVDYHPRTGELKPVVNINAFREAMEDE